MGLNWELFLIAKTYKGVKISDLSDSEGINLNYEVNTFLRGWFPFESEFDHEMHDEFHYEIKSKNGDPEKIIKELSNETNVTFSFKYSDEYDDNYTMYIGEDSDSLMEEDEIYKGLFAAFLTSVSKWNLNPKKKKTINRKIQSLIGSIQEEFYKNVKSDKELHEDADSEEEVN